MNSVNIILVSVVAGYFVITSHGLECTTNRCPDNEKCYERHVPGQPEYVCECAKPFFHGYDCRQTLNNNDIDTCYGPSCSTGSYSTPGYPTAPYQNRERILYLLYIPWATEIRFSFDLLFGIERKADELFVGSGLSVPSNSLGLENALQPRLYFFEGSSTPQPFSVYNDTAFVYFVTDNGGQSLGFRINWNATVAVPPTTDPPTTDPPTTEAATTQSAATAAVFQHGVATALLIAASALAVLCSCC